MDKDSTIDLSLKNSFLGFFDKQLLNELFGSVSTSAPSNSILNFLYEYYQYPDINKEHYKSVFKNNNVPLNIDYLQIDLEPSNGSTINTLKKLDNEIFDKYKHDAQCFIVQ